MKNILQERAYMALQLTMNQPIPRNQWHQQVLDQANQLPTSEKLWPQSASSMPKVISDQEFQERFGNTLAGRLQIL